MVEDRIQINGEWYVKEKQEEINVDYTFTKSCIVEIDNFAFEATKIMRDYESYYPDVSIEVTIKEGDRKNWRTEYWDNTDFFTGILDGDKDCIEDFTDTITEKYDQQVFLNMLNKLKEIEWL